MALESKVMAERESLFMRLKEATTELVSSFWCQLIIIGILCTHAPLLSPLPASQRLLSELEFYPVIWEQHLSLQWPEVKTQSNLCFRHYPLPCLVSLRSCKFHFTCRIVINPLPLYHSIFNPSISLEILGLFSIQVPMPKKSSKFTLRRWRWGRA